MKEKGETVTQNHIKSKLRFASLTIITLSWFFVQNLPTFAPLIFWCLTIAGWVIALVIYSWKGRKAPAFLASNERVLRVFDFIFVLGYIWITGGAAQSPYLILIYLGIASVGLYDEKQVGLLYSLLAVAVLLVYDLSYQRFWAEEWKTSYHVVSHIFMLPLFGIMADLLIAHFRHIKQEERAVLEELVASLAKAIGSKDSYTLGHSTRVQHYAVALGEELGLNQEDMFTLKFGAMLHDIGKIHIPSSLLNKPGRLTKEEWDQLQEHAVEGARIVGSLKKLTGVRDIILYHHEKYDGHGYPRGLKGDEIPFLAAIVNVADSFDAMTTSRTYNKPKTVEEGIAELERCSGTQFHPLAAAAAVSLYKESKWPRFKSVEYAAQHPFVSWDEQPIFSSGRQ
ncbi:HD-GYP domain-containing protein [Aneurinibacillus tyrosinisolvens]|uniref:HD-GYP domain-containing protein n=1 Tax=Aneurinibacillus tyrosinisolvens TaxID=1443435 RepID=UPI00069C3832|nr:HD-GYP domain-containing protein [Aneurinibacillus tyrosinisolvens]